jgi:hypothetical protein
VVALVASIICRGMWSGDGRAHAAVLEPMKSTAISDLNDPPDDPADDLEAPPQYDVYGNEVDDAVGGYRIDPLGDEYEEHSPDTEIVRLGPPIG